jgi:MFS family permease
MKEAKGTTANPFKESFTYPGNAKRLFVALFGIAAGLTVIWYTAMFSTLSFLQGPMRVEQSAAQLIVGAGALFGLGWFIFFGRLSDRVGRRKPILIGYALTLLLLFPLFKLMGAAANPAMAAAAERAPVAIERTACDFDPFAGKQRDLCGQVLAELARLGVPYTFRPPSIEMEGVGIRAGDRRLELAAAAEVQPFLESAGYSFARTVPPAANILLILGVILVLTALSGATYGPVAALLAELFPARIRYSSMSIPYHFGTGYFGGFLPFIASYVIATTGDPYAGLWYTWTVVAMALAVSYF